MQLNNAALNRLADAKFNADTTAALFVMLAAQADVLCAPSGVLTLDYYQPGDPIEPGDLIPQLTFALRPYHLHERQAYESTIPPKESDPSLPSSSAEESGATGEPSSTSLGG